MSKFASKSLKFKPYARLLTMLGDQLIKNERIALVEVIKNSYDADASWVTVDFQSFSTDFQASADSKIVIEDDGTGMSRETIEKHWVNPATPTKLLAKKVNAFTEKGRIIQGEKGIGRFALLKLGRKIEITTRTDGADTELRLTLDVSEYNSDFIPEDETQPPLFLDEIKLTLEEFRPPRVIDERTVQLGARDVVRAPHGTRIEISHLASPWSTIKVDKAYSDLIRLQTIFFDPTVEGEKSAKPKKPAKNLDSFDVSILRNSRYAPFSDRYKQRLRTLITENSVFRVEDGQYDQDLRRFTFELNGAKTILSLDDPDITGLTIFRNYFGLNGDLPKETSCGPFGFSFYVFDFSADARGSLALDGEDKKLIKEHRIYLYRDGIRVYPYGDPEDDWLGIDIYRGTVRASEFLSNDQVVGFVNISQSKNPFLRDKTNREGLIDEGSATSDFFELLRVILAWVRKKPYAQYRASLKAGGEVEIFKAQKVQAAFDELADGPLATPQLRTQLAAIKGLYQAERSYLVQRAETTEHLAGVGLSVETASHDLMTAMQQSLTVLDALIGQTQRPGVLNKAIVNRDLNTIRGMLSFVQSQIKDIQLLFRSSKQRRKDVRVKEVLEKVMRIFAPALQREDIKVEVDETKAPLIAKTTDAVLLQLFLNLFDNAAYWLQSSAPPRRIRVILNGDDGEMIFSDSGPGIKKEDIPYIFDPFYSGKGEEGRGLGLYIARQLLDRHDYGIELADLKSQRPLRGASFVISFVKAEK